MKEPDSGSSILLRNRFRLSPVQGCGIILALTALNALAQTYSVLHHFQGDDGKCPWAGLVESSNVLYGTTRGLIYALGSDNWGEVFRINKDGTDFRILRQFTGEDGSHPTGKLVLVGNTLYGTSCNAGNSGYGFGNIFKINTDGTDFTVLKQFTGEPDAAYPMAGLLLVGSTFYGTTAGSIAYPGAAASAVFSINTDGSGYSILKRFSGPDGSWLWAPVIHSANTLFGTTGNGGAGGCGTLFRLNTDGSGYAILHNFSGGIDGREPHGQLLLIGTTLFGTTWGGGGSQQGTIFKINTDGTGYQTLKSLGWDANGAFPETGLLQFGNTLLAVPRGGGRVGGGTIFKMGFDGSGFAKLLDFPGQNGSSPYVDLLLSGTTLYGTTSFSITEQGSTGVGVIYSFQLVPDSTTPP